MVLLALTLGSSKIKIYMTYKRNIKICLLKSYRKRKHFQTFDFKLYNPFDSLHPSELDFIFLIQTYTVKWNHFQYFVSGALDFEFQSKRHPLKGSFVYKGQSSPDQMVHLNSFVFPNKIFPLLNTNALSPKISCNESTWQF